MLTELYLYFVYFNSTACKEEEDEEEECAVKIQTASSELSCVSMKSRTSMMEPFKFSDGAVTSDHV